VNVLIACEFSGVVRNAFASRGHRAISCDLLPSEDGSPDHVTGDVLELLAQRPGFFDLMIAHPPCTRLTVAGARWFKGLEKEQAESIRFVETLWTSAIGKIAIENPIGVLSTRSILRKPTQIIQPWQFGCGETKATCFWLKGLAPLLPTDVVSGRVARVHREPPGPDRWKRRSRTYQGIANAMAEQWGIEDQAGQQVLF
jgi:site-specific DNA-cytosine methylase